MTVYFGIDLKVCEGVYEPSDDTFLLAGEIDSKPGETVLDMGTGTGLLGLVAAKKGSKVLGVDISDSAVGCALENARINGLKAFSARESDLFSNVHESFDLIVFNPPYLPTEEGEVKDVVSRAWDGGRSGREIIDPFLWEFKRHLLPGGRLLLLSSSLSNYGRTMDVLRGLGFGVEILSRCKFDFEELVVLRAVYDF